MKRGIVNTILILALVWLCSSTYAEEQARLWFDVNNDGEEYTVSVHISGNTGIEMLQFCLRYDSEKLELKSATAGDAFRGTTAPTISTKESGRVYLVWDALKPLPNGELLVLRFAVREDAAGNALLFFDGDFETIAADGDYNEKTLQTEKLEIAIGTLIASPMETSAVPEVTLEPRSKATPGPLAPSDSPAETELTLKPTTSSAVEHEQSAQKPNSMNTVENTTSSEEKPAAASALETKGTQSITVALIVICLVVLVVVAVTLVFMKSRQKTE